MQFFEQHFSKHHLLHAPHKCFLALLCSPIHYGEKHYQKRYHLRFKHAKKLFVFDLSLLASIFVLLGATLFWFFYNPKVTELVDLNITLGKEKIKSGEYITYNVNYQNRSDVKLIKPKLVVTMPKSFLLDSNSTTTINLEDLNSGHSGQVQISGWSYGEPEKEEKIIAELIYQQDKRKILETRLTSLLQTNRDSILKTEITNLETILNQGEKDLEIIFTNNGDRTLPEVFFPLSVGNGLSLIITNPEIGKIENNWFKVENINPDSIISIKAKLKSTLSPGATGADFKIAPAILINQNKFNQKAIEKTLKVIRPSLTINSTWTKEKEFLNPGDSANLKITILNTGSIDLQNIILEIPTSANLIDTNRLTTLNHGSYRNQTLIINKNFAANLSSLLAGQSTEINLTIPVSYSPSGAEDLNLKLNPKIKAEVKNLNNTFETSAETEAIKIATNLKMTAEIRYYTSEGDQLGRGPIPPQVGQETKYWALVNIKNGTSQVNNATFSATLPDYVNWTGKNSVSIGEGVKYNANSHTLTWYLRYLPAFEEAVINFEMALTPLETQRGTTPILLKNVTLTGKVAYTEADIIKNLGNLDASLPTDTITKEKGVLVQ